MPLASRGHRGSQNVLCAPTTQPWVICSAVNNATQSPTIMAEQTHHCNATSNEKIPRLVRG